MNETYRKLSLSIGCDTLDDLKALAASQNRTVAEYVRALVSCHVAAERKRPRPQFVARETVAQTAYKGRIMKCE